MELIELFGFICALIIGVSLGLIGGGGSILAVPVLAYLFSFDERIATSYSLFIVGTSALIGGLKQHFKGYVDWKTAIIFGLPAIVGVSLVRHFLVPILPDELFNIGIVYFYPPNGHVWTLCTAHVSRCIFYVETTKSNQLQKRKKQSPTITP